MAHSYSYLLKRAGLLPGPPARQVARPVRVPQRCRMIYARFHQPEIQAIPGDRAVTRIVNLNNRSHRAWVADVSASYATLGEGHALTSFFPDHP